MKKLKSTSHQVWQSFHFAFFSFGFQRSCKKKFRAFQSDFKNEVYADGEIRVLSGPFAGMKYYDQIVWGPITPKWIGSFENHLQGVIRKVIGVEYTKILDVGAAEGYYAVGLVLRSPKSQVMNFDVHPIGRKRQRELASLNSVNNLEVRKLCTHEELSGQLEDRCLVVRDIEGYEAELLNPHSVRSCVSRMCSSNHTLLGREVWTTKQPYSNHALQRAITSRVFTSSHWITVC
jgi:hypothetical protein